MPSDRRRGHPIRLVALDLDGTTLNSAGLISPRTASVLRWLSAQSVHVVAATGRSPSRQLREICQPGLFGWVICSNGATLHDIDRDTVVLSTRIPEGVLAALRAHLAADLPTAALAWGTAGQICERPSSPPSTGRCWTASRSLRAGRPRTAS